MVDPTTVLALGICLIAISLYNFKFISDWIKKYIDLDGDENKNNSEKISINLLTKIPLDVLQKIQQLLLISIPMLFFGVFMVLYGVSF